jgi:uncharacterized repeat protein (TIGR03837 family)
MARYSQSWDIFCKVVDNLGDIGVCWRLAKQLANEHAVTIRLWVDDMSLARHFAGDGLAQITLLRWDDHADFTHAAPVVIETFGCGLPEAYQAAMLKQSSLWINVDYLSAESWVEAFHALPSPQANGLVRYFFYPGFSPNTGGLIREANLPALQHTARWSKLKIMAESQKCTVSLFCYAHAPLSTLVESFCHSPQALRVLVAEPVIPALAKVLNLPDLAVGNSIQIQQAEFVMLPFMAQEDYDRLLYLCDLNFVRGEDSWIRALWAGKPLVWLPYQQSEATHLLKLKAFLTHYLADASPALSEVCISAMLAWAQGDWQPHHWQTLLQVMPQLSSHAKRYAENQSLQQDLATKLVIFIEKCRAHQV